LILQVLPQTAEDRLLLERDLSWKYAAQDAGWYADRDLARGTLLAIGGEHTDAIARFRAALDNRADARTHAMLAGALADAGNLTQAMLHARAALQLGPSDPLAFAALARLLAQHPDPAVRNPGEARSLVRRAEREVHPEDVAGLAALAAAQAAIGERDRATRSIERAIAVARRAGDDTLTSALEHRLSRLAPPSNREH
jgi:tetratricopeptide (TPR) repeat protein